MLLLASCSMTMEQLEALKSMKDEDDTTQIEITIIVNGDESVEVVEKTDE